MRRMAAEAGALLALTAWEAIQKWQRVLELDPRNPCAPRCIEKAKPRRTGPAPVEGPTPVGGSPVAGVTAGSTAAATGSTAEDESAARDADERAVGAINAGQFQQALPDLEEAVRHKPDFVNAFVARGGAYPGLKQHARAAADCERALKMTPDQATPPYGLRRAHEKPGGKGKAIVHHRRYSVSTAPDANKTLHKTAKLLADALQQQQPIHRVGVPLGGPGPEPQARGRNGGRDGDGAPACTRPPSAPAIVPRAPRADWLRATHVVLPGPARSSGQSTPSSAAGVQQLDNSPSRLSTT